MTDGTPTRWWLAGLGTVGALVLGGVFLLAAWAKALDPVAFEEHVVSQGLGFGMPAVMALVGIGLEVALGLALLLNLRRPYVLGPAGLLVVFFVFLTGRTYAQHLTTTNAGTGALGLVAGTTIVVLVGLGAVLMRMFLPRRNPLVHVPFALLLLFLAVVIGWMFLHLPADGPATVACGCFGSLIERTPAEAFWQDVLLLVPPFLMAVLLGRPAPAPRRDWPRVVAVGGVTVAALVFTVLAPDLPLDDLATRLSPGVAMTDVCAGQDDQRVCLSTVLPEAEAGIHLVTLVDLDDEDFLAVVERMNEVALGPPGGPRIWVLTDAPEEDRSRFYWTYGPAFEVREGPRPLLRPLYRRLPRSFRVVDGAVVETYDGLPPLPEGAGDSLPE